MSRNVIDVCREGIAQTLKEAMSGFSSDAYSPQKINPPALFPGPHSAEPNDTEGGKTITFKWWIAVRATDKTKLRDLDQALLDACAAIDANPGLGLSDGTVDAAWSEWGDYGDVEIAGTPFYGALLSIECMVGG